MRSADVQIGAEYWAKVTGKLVRVRIERLAEYGKGWWATNVTTGRLVRIKTGARLRPAGRQGCDGGCLHGCSSPCRVCRCALAAAQSTISALRMEV